MAMDAIEQPIKNIYLVSRNPEMDRDRFVRRWRQHGSLGMSMEGWRNVKRYAHCDIRGELSEDGRFEESAFDGFGMIWHRSAAHRADHMSNPGARAAMMADERETFADLVGTARLAGAPVGIGCRIVQAAMVLDVERRALE